MKLAHALAERADLQRRLHQLTQRMTQNAQYQEGETPVEDPKELLHEFRQVLKQWQDLVSQINLCNSRIQLPNGIKMTTALAQRDALTQEHAALVELANAAIPEQSRYSRSEIKMLSAIDVKAIRTQADKIAKTVRELDLMIQETNWSSEL